jgi:hypothetical protein
MKLRKSGAGFHHWLARVVAIVALALSLLVGTGDAARAQELYGAGTVRCHDTGRIEVEPYFAEIGWPNGAVADQDYSWQVWIYSYTRARWFPSNWAATRSVARGNRFAYTALPWYTERWEHGWYKVFTYYAWKLRLPGYDWVYRGAYASQYDTYVGGGRLLTTPVGCQAFPNLVLGSI